jgi:hypothetical protein
MRFIYLPFNLASNKYYKYLREETGLSLSTLEVVRIAFGIDQMLTN